MRIADGKEGSQKKLQTAGGRSCGGSTDSRSGEVAHAEVNVGARKSSSLFPTVLIM